MSKFLFVTCIIAAVVVLATLLSTPASASDEPMGKVRRSKSPVKAEIEKQQNATRALRPNGGAHGIDVSLMSCQAGISFDTWKCLVNNGFEFAIIQAWNGGYNFNQKMKTCVNDAWRAGMKHVDVYVFMCPNCRNNYPASDAMSTIARNLKSENITFGQLWIDVEQCTGCWNDIASNAAYVREAASAAVQHLGKDKVGVYSSMYEWERTVGKESSLSYLPQWYAHWDGLPNFSDTWASQWGGWTKPNIKQYNDHGPCGIDVDVNWYPV